MLRVSAVKWWVLALLTTRGWALSCYICGDNNLDEFGECSTQFQYNCSSYAKRFPEDERIFCRTTRHRAQNNTFTIMKECISERDHYKTFPEKSYRLDEECDVIDVEGDEIAYCLCRHQELCNKQPIAEQFMAFEEAHPELFGSEEDESASQERGGDKLVDGPAAVTPITPVNDPRGQSRSNTNVKTNSMLVPSIEVRRQPLPSRGEQDFTIASPELRINPPTIPVGGLFAGIPGPAPPGHFTGPQLFPNAPLLQIPGLTTPLFPTPTVPLPIAEENEGISCMQCAQGAMQDSAKDCDHQASVVCPAGSLCFTRQILLGPGQNAVEKMCVTKKALVEEYGAQVDTNGCSSANDDAVRFCVCESDDCNKPHIDIQISAKGEDVSQRPQPPTSTLPQPIRPSNDWKSKADGVLHCLVCSEGDLHDSSTDCSRAYAVDCTKNTNERMFCLTRQTQLASGVFNVEKRCISESEFGENFPEETASPLREGCSSAFDGLVSFCLCESELCNRESLLLQSKTHGILPPKTTERTSARPVTTATTEQRSSNDVTEDGNERFKPIMPHIVTEGTVDSTEEDLQENSVDERQRAWKEASDVLAASASSSLPRLLSFVPLMLLFI